MEVALSVGEECIQVFSPFWSLFARKDPGSPHFFPRIFAAFCADVSGWDRASNVWWRWIASGTREALRGQAAPCSIRRLRAQRAYAHRAGRHARHQREQADSVWLPVQVLGGGLVCAAEQQDGRRPEQDPHGGTVHDRDLEGRGHGHAQRALPVGLGGDQRQSG
eukprot:scaffold1803_cov261-Pinguiococcus_pyrenoidosus.AAC.4